jgi:hypothetical protein
MPGASNSTWLRSQRRKRHDAALDPGFGVLNAVKELALMSWRSVLSVMSDAAAEPEAFERQIFTSSLILPQGWIPTHFFRYDKDELSCHEGLRMYQFHEIVNDAVNILSKEGVFSKTRKSGGLRYYGSSVFWLVYAYTHDHKERGPSLTLRWLLLPLKLLRDLLRGDTMKLQ